MKCLKRFNTDKRGYMQWITAVVVVLILAAGFVMITGGSGFDWDKQKDDTDTDDTDTDDTDTNYYDRIYTYTHLGFDSDSLAIEKVDYNFANTGSINTQQLSISDVNGRVELDFKLNGVSYGERLIGFRYNVLTAEYTPDLIPSAWDNINAESGDSFEISVEMYVDGTLEDTHTISGVVS